jgi:anti-sigma regulatory factor (Ser/Thr protein kinase)
LALSNQAAVGAGIRHVAWLYRSPEELVTGVHEYAEAGAPLLVAILAGRLRDGLRGDMVAVLDVAELGRNPARLMPELRGFADEHPGRRVRVLAELAWPGRSAAELREISRYEAMLDLAFAGVPVSIVCPYSEAELSAPEIKAARRSHRRLLRAGHELDSADYPGGAGSSRPAGGTLLAPPGARSLAYQRNLRPVRGLVGAVAAQAGLAADRCADLVIAASEVAANTLKHTSGGGIVRVWATGDEVLCQLEDGGHITDPLAGYRRPAGDVAAGQGLWLVNQVCDLAEVRTSEAGTTIRLHMDRDPQKTVPLRSRVPRAAAGYL